MEKADAEVAGTERQAQPHAAPSDYNIDAKDEAQRLASRHRPGADDEDSHDAIESQHSHTSVWASETMSLPQEVLFITTVCMTQFCNRACASYGAFPHERC